MEFYTCQFLVLLLLTLILISTKFCYSELTQIIGDVIADPTLPRTEDHPCPKCGQKESVFFQSHSSKAEVCNIVFLLFPQNKNPSIWFPHHNCEKNHAINFKLGMWLAHKESKNPIIFGHVGQGKRSQILKMEIQFLHHNSRMNHAINFKLGIWPARKESKNPIDFVGQNLWKLMGWHLLGPYEGQKGVTFGQF